MVPGVYSSRHPGGKLFIYPGQEDADACESSKPGNWLLDIRCRCRQTGPAQRRTFSMPESLSQAFSELSNPQYRHVLLLPLLVHGLILAGLMAMVSSIFKQNRAAAFAFLLVAVCALAVRPYLDARASALSAIQAAQTSYKATEIAAIAERLGLTST